MKKIIHHLRKQPEHYRRHVLHVVVFAATVILVFIWIYTLGLNFTNENTQVKLSKDLEPISVIKDNIVNGYTNFTQPSGSGGGNTTQTQNQNSTQNLQTQENNL